MVMAAAAAAAPWPQQGEGAAGGLGAVRGGNVGMADLWFSGSTQRPERERWDERAGTVPTLPLLFLPA